MRIERKKTTGNQAGAATSTRAAPDDQRPVYFISVVAEMVETHPQTLRMYERMGLICPCRTRAGVRLYSHADVEQVRRIQHLTQEIGVNLAGVEVIFDLLREMQRLQAEMEEMQSAQDAPRKAGKAHV
jgi:MerR family transcriptional regulator/heat shock protein HspR